MRKITADTVYDFKSVGNPRFSPDGKRLCFSVASCDRAKNGYVSDIWEKTDAGLKRLTFSGDCFGFTWSESGTLLFSALREEPYVSMKKSGEEITCFYELDPAAGEAHLAFTLPCNASNLQRIDGSLYVFAARLDHSRPDVCGLSQDERKKALLDHMAPAYDQFTELPFWMNGLDVIDRRRDAVCLYDRASGSITMISDPECHAYFQCYKDGSVYYTGGPAGDDRVHRSGIYRYDIATGKTETMLDWRENVLVNRVDVMGGDLLLIAAFDSPMWTEDGLRFYKLDGKTKKISLFNRYEFMKAAGGAATDINQTSGIRAKMTEKGFYFLTYIVDHACLKLLRPDGVIEDVYSPAMSFFTGFDIFEDRLITAEFTDRAPAELFENGKRITGFNDELMKELFVSIPEPMTFVASDGYEISGWVMKPWGYVPGRKHPGILNIHGGPRGASNAVLDHASQVYAAEGYFVFYCNHRGSDGRGDNFANITGLMGDVDFKNLMDFTDEVLKRYPDIDEDRLGVAGGSYGGFMCNWIIGHTNRFKAACSQRSVSNWITFEHTCDIGPGYTLGYFGTNTQKNAGYLWDRSPLKYADNVTTPTLFIYSDRDVDCWMGETVQMFTALQMRGIPSRVCVFHGENHGLSRNGRPKNRISRLREITGWFDKYLK